MDEDQNTIINQRETLTEVLESLISVKGSGFWTVINAVLGIASIGWLADSILPILQGWSLSWWTGKVPDELSFLESFYKLTIPVGWFLLYVGFLFFIRLHKLKMLQYQTEGSFPRRGLIISLSPLNEKQIKLSELEKQIDDKTLDLEHFYNNSNWGQLAFTIAHHSQLLQKCWVCSTPKSTTQFAVAKKLINFTANHYQGRAINCIETKIEDENDISLMAREVSWIYRSLGDVVSNLQPRDVVSNYTGGTSAMTGGIIMATLKENREIEYVNQKYSGILSSELLRNIERNLAIVTSKTNLVAVEKIN